MSPFPAAVLLLLLAAGLCAGWRRWDKGDYRQRPRNPHIGNTPAPTCDKATERFVFCGPYCQLTCDRPFSRPCPRMCGRGCMCNRGLVRDEATGKCVTRDRCSAPKPVECTGKKVAVLCGNMNNTDLNRYCPMWEARYGAESRARDHRCSGADGQRTAVCACPLPHRVDRFLNCMPIEKCPMCATHERYSRCRAHCQPSCGRPKRPRGCSKVCKPGCACTWLYLRDEASGKCVPSDTCPSPRVATIFGHASTRPAMDAVRSCRGLTKCPGCTGIYTDWRGCTKCRRCPWHLPTCYARDCGYTPAAEITCSASGTEPVPCRIARADRPCPRTYGHRPPHKRVLCTAAEKRRGVYCGCKPKHRLNQSGVCVPVGQCDRRRCRSTGTFSPCHAHCQPSCGRPQGPRHCTGRCRPGCMCNMGYLRDDSSGECVLRDDCPGGALTTRATVAPSGACARHRCAPCHKCRVNNDGEPKCVHKGTCYDEFPGRGCPPDQHLCRTSRSYCHSAHVDCASGYSCVANYCGCRAMYYDPKLNRVPKCKPTTPKPTVAPRGACVGHRCAPCHKCKLNPAGEPKCVHKGTCFDEFPYKGCPSGQYPCLTIIPLCGHGCASAYSFCVNNKCKCRPMFYDANLNEVAKCRQRP